MKTLAVSKCTTLEWNRYCQLDQERNPFMSSVYASAISKVTQLNYDYLIVSDNDMPVVGVCVYYKLKHGKKFASHPVLTPYNSVVVFAHGSDLVSESIKMLLSYVYSAYVYPYLLNQPEVPDVNLDVFQLNYGQTIVSDPAVNRLDADIKRRAKKCAGEGFYISKEYNAKWFCDLYQGTMERQSISLNMSRSLLEELICSVSEIGNMYSSFDAAGNLHASWIQLSDDSSTVYNWMATSNINYLSSGGTPFLVASIREDLETRGFRRWDLCGADIPSVAKFKKSIGGEMVPYSKYSIAKYPLINRIIYKLYNKF